MSNTVCLLFQVVTPRKQGDQYVYEEPKSLIPGGQDYDVPRSHLTNQSCPIYDEPQFRDEGPTSREDKPLPPPPSHVYAVPSEERAATTSNRSSVASMFSTGSNSQSAGGESRASSMEIPGQDVYDVPPPPKFVNSSHVLSQAPPPPMRSVTLGNRQHGNQEVTYDRPRNTKEFSPERDYMEINDMPTKNPSKDFQSKYIEDYDVPKSDTSRSSGDSGIDTSKLEHMCDIDTDDVYDTPKRPVRVSDIGSEESSARPESSTGMDVYSTPRSSKVPQDLYDSPKTLNTTESVYSVPTNNSPAPPQLKTHRKASPPRMQSVSPSRQGDRAGSGAVYDVPSNVRGSGGDNRVSTASTNSGGSDIGPIPYDTLDIDLDTAMQRLNNLIQECQKATSKLLSYVKVGWRRAELIEPRIPVLKESSQYVHRTMRSFVEFGQGTLANSAKAEDRGLAKKLCKHLAPVEESTREVGKCLGNMEVGCSWELARLVHHAPTEKGDDLDMVIHRTREFPPAVSALASLIKGNATLLFTPSPLVNSVPVTKPKRPPPPVKPKPKLTLDKKVPLEPGRRSGVQDRPLPTLPPTNNNNNTTSQASGALYDVPRSAVTDNKDTKASSEYDYDYVALSRENSAVESSPNRGANPPHSTNNNTTCEYKSAKGMPIDHKEGRALSKTPEPLSVPPNPTTLDSELSRVSPTPPSVPPAPSPAPPSTVAEDEGDYDVPLSNKPLVTAAELEPPKIRTSGLSPKFKERLEQLQAEAQEPVMTLTEGEGNYDMPQGRPNVQSAYISDRDRQILAFYSEQVVTHTSLLLNASEAFFHCCEEGQPPKVFIAHSKFVILAAHKLVYIADTITRCVGSEDVRVKVMTCANRLCDALKLTVTATKAAALSFPQILAVQDLVDRVVEVTQAAHSLKAQISRPLKS